MNDKNWRRLSDGKPVKDFDKIRQNPADYTDEIFYKERIHDGSSVYGQLMIITYSPAYALYQRNVRQSQIERAEKKIYDLDDAAIEKEARRWLYIKSDHSNTKGLQSAKN